MLNNSFESIEQMENYAEKSVSSVYYLLLESSNVRNVHADHAASHLGKAQGLCHLLRGVPLSRQINLIALPQDLLLEHKVSQEDVIRGRKLDEIKEIAFNVATRANQHLEKVRQSDICILRMFIDICLPYRLEAFQTNCPTMREQCCFLPP